jgi:cyclopropane-fatty-acyl-phospholipid synthase
MRSFLKLLEGIRTGGLWLRMPDGSRRYFGDRESPLQGEMTLYDYSFFRKTVLGGDVGLGEAYVAGIWDTEDIPTLFSILIRNRRALVNGYPVTAWLARRKNRIVHALRANTARGARKNIEAHYDLSNDLFQTFLDRRLLYSCGIYADGLESCEDAQERKIEEIIRKVEIRVSDSVLDIGCGGAALRRGGKKDRLSLTGITVSEKQHALPGRWWRGRDLRTGFHLLVDYRDVSGIFDKIVSIEMLEAVGISTWAISLLSAIDCSSPVARF